MLVTRKSNLTGNTHSREIAITEAEFAQVEARQVAIQKIVPHISAEDREFLISGITPEEWDKAFPEEDEDGYGEIL